MKMVWKRKGKCETIKKRRWLERKKERKKERVNKWQIIEKEKGNVKLKQSTWLERKKNAEKEVNETQG